MEHIINNKKCLDIHSEYCKHRPMDMYNYFDGEVWYDNRFKCYYYEHLPVAILDLETGYVYDVSEIFHESKVIGHSEAEWFFKAVTLEGHPPMFVYVVGF